jgi:hypothetical protein
VYSATEGRPGEVIKIEMSPEKPAGCLRQRSLPLATIYLSQVSKRNICSRHRKFTD